AIAFVRRDDLRVTADAVPEVEPMPHVEHRAFVRLGFDDEGDVTFPIGRRDPEVGGHVDGIPVRVEPFVARELGHASMLRGYGRVHPFDVGPEGAELVLEALVPAVDVYDVLDEGPSGRGEPGQDERGP